MIGKRSEIGVIAFLSLFALRYHVMDFDSSLALIHDVYDTVWHAVPYGHRSLQWHLSNQTTVNYLTSYEKHWPRASLLADLYAKKQLALKVHLTGTAIGLLAFPFQTSAHLRTAYPNVHRWTGRLALSCLAVGMISATPLIADQDTMYAACGFCGMALAVVVCGAMALYQIVVNKDVGAHRAWAVRCYAVLLGGYGSFRLMLVFGWLDTSKDAWIMWSFITFFSWVSALPFAELYLRRNPLMSKQSPRVSGVTSAPFRRRPGVGARRHADIPPPSRRNSRLLRSSSQLH
eukprot:TRINITY_DN14428_c0_g1_i1.p1 TRINITY_DN14428_c0_g1~~TRINITY_DN14428_c0_g1_i1.p1  ORF type:complete len:289 (+),score=59.06 TRINITY_DN14428_c0_g1_i1:69-935(+)